MLFVMCMLHVHVINNSVSDFLARHREMFSDLGEHVHACSVIRRMICDAWYSVYIASLLYISFLPAPTYNQAT